MRKSLFFLFIFIFLTVSLACGTFAGTKNFSPGTIAVCLNGDTLEFDVPPVFCQGEPMLPLRKICEALGFEVIWEMEPRRVTLRGWGEVIILYPGNPLYSINEVVYRASLPPFIVEGRTMAGLDFLEKIAALEDVVWEQHKNRVEMTVTHRGDKKPIAGPPRDGPHQTYFAEVLLPSEDVAVGQEFTFGISAPFVKGIYAYEIIFSYDPEVMEVKDIKNPAYNPEMELSRKNFANPEGTAAYTQITLGFQEEIPPRTMLAIFSANALGEGMVSFNKHTLKLKLLDNTAAPMPVLLTDKIVYVR